MHCVSQPEKDNFYKKVEFDPVCTFFERKMLLESETLFVLRGTQLHFNLFKGKI
ncbi:unnamed protein product [Larinioides sclopetarius]|uniref:Uncharacterized protein n=1 Tax=Larinioides sclopetarius TaxID=280406 RepID=A0AAV1ZTL9_9ARAC